MALSNKLGAAGPRHRATRARSRSATARSTGTWWAASRRCATSPRPGSTAWRDGATRRRGARSMPEGTIARPPTAELRPGQLDTDSLPPYDVLDAILEGYVEQGLEPDELVRRGHPEIIVGRGRADGRSRRVQATSGARGHQDHAARLRPRPAHADNDEACRRSLRATGVAAVAMIALAAAALPAAAAGPSKGDALGPEGPGGSVATEAGAGFGRTPAAAAAPAGHVRGRPHEGRRGRAARRASAPSTPVLPEAGVWSVTADEPATARDRALARPQVSGAEWSLARTLGGAPPPPPPAPLGPAPALHRPVLHARTRSGASWPAARSGAPTSPRPRPGRASRSSTAGWTRPTRSGPGRPAPWWRGAARCAATTTPPTAATPATAPTWPASRPRPPTGSGSSAWRRRSRPTAQIIPVQIANRIGESSDLTMIRGIRHAVRNGAKVVNISAGGEGFAPRLPGRRSSGRPARARVIVASVGNDYEQHPQLPGRLQPGARRGRPVRRQAVTSDCPAAVRAADLLEPQPLGGRHRPRRERPLAACPGA